MDCKKIDETTENLIFICREIWNAFYKSKTYTYHVTLPFFLITINIGLQVGIDCGNCADTGVIFVEILLPKLDNQYLLYEV